MRWHALTLCAALFVAGPASAAPLFKLIDRQGRVTFTDAAPKEFDGQVIRLELSSTPTIPPPPKPALPPEARPATASPAEGYGERRRRSRAELQGRVDKARAGVEEARRAKGEGSRATPEEMQVIQRRFPPLKSGQTPPYPNCAQRMDPGSGTAVLICPTQVPGPAYHDRQRRLEAALASAEAELAEAETAFRRGTD